MLFANLPLSRRIKSARQHILADLRKIINLFVPPFPPDRGRPFRSVSVFTIPPSILFDFNNFPPGRGRPFRCLSVPTPSSPFARGRPFRSVSGTTFLPPLSLVWSSVFLCPFLVSLPTYGPAAGDRSKVIAPCSALHGQRSRAGWASLSSWPIGLVRACSLLPSGSSLLHASTSLTVIPTPGYFLVLALRLTYENMAYRWSITGTWPPLL